MKEHINNTAKVWSKFENDLKGLRDAFLKHCWLNSLQSSSRSFVNIQCNFTTQLTYLFVKTILLCHSNP